MVHKYLSFKILLVTENLCLQKRLWNLNSLSRGTVLNMAEVTQWRKKKLLNSSETRLRFLICAARQTLVVSNWIISLTFTLYFNRDFKMWNVFRICDIKWKGLHYVVNLLIVSHSSLNRWIGLYHPVITVKLITVMGLSGTLRTIQYVMLQFLLFFWSLFS